ncbi:MAG TPA: DUF4157 domain-containing protein, partial [Ktedonobacteraceae bacterium]|nr:DUF4157 domain-containing protein [Ktedonobacteraceae bacterium]
GVENLSGLSMDDVRVHYHSSEPARVQALAYTQGTDIHVGPGQEHHLPHEAWHVVQQKQGRVQPTIQAQGVSINDDATLEREADQMGARANTLKQQRVDVTKRGSGRVTQLYSAVIQRAITVQNIDYDPVANEFRHGIIQQAQFYQTLRAAIQGDNRFENYLGQLNNVMQGVAEQDFAQPDIDAVTTAIATAIRAAYNNRGLVLNNATLVAALTQHIRAALVAHIQPDHAMMMDEQERTAFDQLAGIGAAQMSRAKATPGQIPYNSLPAAIRNSVDAVLADIRAENALWTVAGLGPRYTLPDTTTFAAEIANRQRGLRYQGNHTNLAGWLPAVAVPVNQIPIIANAIYAAATSELQKRLLRNNALVRMGFEGAGLAHPNRYRDEYNQLRAARLAPLGNAGLRLSVWASLAGGVSAYIEFHMAGGMSRLIYDPVNNRVYITAHYKWRQGNNPFFQVTAFPAV